MDDLTYETPDYSNDSDAVSPARPKKMKKAHPSMRINKMVPKWLIDQVADKGALFKIEAIVAKTGHNVDEEYGDGKADVTLSFHSIKKVSKGKLSKSEYLNASEEEREEHNKETVMK